MSLVAWGMMLATWTVVTVVAGRLFLRVLTTPPRDGDREEGGP